LEAATTNHKEESASSLDYRIIDANLNRLREGIRVVEDIYRYHFNNSTISKQLKSLRHQTRVDDYQYLLKNRDIIGDVGKSTTQSEKSRDSIDDILISNFKRAQESSRVLEEMYKLTSTKQSQIFKNIRYELYNLEKVKYGQ
jgi:thiamine-phosphate pyrophosphorylase